MSAREISIVHSNQEKYHPINWYYSVNKLPKIKYESLFEKICLRKNKAVAPEPEPGAWSDGFHGNCNEPIIVRSNAARQSAPISGIWKVGSQPLLHRDILQLSSLLLTTRVSLQETPEFSSQDKLKGIYIKIKWHLDSRGRRSLSWGKRA